jgi:hypothetical protein
MAHMKMIIAAALVGALAGGLAACANQVIDGPPINPGTPVNSTCPILHQKVDPTVTVRYKGQLIGFCCSECVDDWVRMGDDLKDQKLKDSM